jgi:hypothetical protein
VLELEVHPNNNNPITKITKIDIIFLFIINPPFLY